MKVGCAGFPLRREQYFREFRVVEVQQTFYYPPKLDTVRRWRDEAPEAFEFTLKAFQVITHPPSSPTYRRYKGERPSRAGNFLPSKEVFQAWETMLEIAKLLESRIIIFQMPPSFSPSSENLDNMERFFRFIERDEFELGIEFRHKDWTEEKIREVCQEYDLFHVVDPFASSRVCGSIPYYRLHGKGGYKYKFTDEDLTWLASTVEPEAYVIFNNVYMLEDARRFLDIIR